MKKISILVTPQTNLGSLDNPRRAFLLVNNLRQKRGKAPLFEVQIIGAEKEILLDNGWYTLYPDRTIGEVHDTDLVLIPAFDGDLKTVIHQNQELVEWIIRQYKNGAEVASLCVGAFLLAATGLLNGKSCSTHWQAATTLKQLFPKVLLTTEKLMTDENGIYTSGGAFSSANLVIYLIEKYANWHLAVECAKMFQIDMDRKSQAHFIIFEGQKAHRDQQVKKAQRYIEKNYQDKLTIDQLCGEVALSRRNFQRRFKKATGNTIIEYIQRVKIEAVKKHLETTRKTVSELMYEVGYSDMKSFRNLFRKITGLSPVEYKRKYNKEIVRG